MERNAIAELTTAPRLATRLQEQPLLEELKSFIHRIYLVSLTEQPIVLLPGANCLFIFGCDFDSGDILIEDCVNGKVKNYSAGCFIGPRERWLRLRPTKQGRFLFVDLHPGAFYKLFKRPCVKFQNNGTTILDLCAFTFGRIREELVLSSNPALVIQHLLMQCAQRQREHIEINSLFDKLVNVVIEADDTTSVRELCELLQINQKRAERVFQKYIGLNPKAFQKVRRYLHAQHMLFAGDKDHRHIASSCGYHDQSHMIRDFKCIAGLTPAKSVVYHSETIDRLSSSQQ